MRYLLLTAILLLLPISLNAETNTDNAKINYQKGLNEKKDRHFTSAIEYFDKTIKLNPKYTNAYLNRGIAKRKIGNLDGAVKDYDKVITLNPKLVDAYYYRGYTKYLIARETGEIIDYEKAIKDFDVTIKLDSKYADAYYYRSYLKYVISKRIEHTHYQKGIDYGEESVNDYLQAVKLNPSYKLGGYLLKFNPYCFGVYD